MESITYRQPRWDAILTPIFTLFFSASIVALAVWAWTEEHYHWDIRSAFHLSMFAFFVVAPWFAIGDGAHTITVSADGKCTFTSSRGEQTIRAQQIKSIIDLDEGPIVVYHHTGKIWLTEIRDVEAFLERVLELNPAIVLDDELTHRLERSRSKLPQAE